MEKTYFKAFVQLFKAWSCPYKWMRLQQCFDSCFLGTVPDTPMPLEALVFAFAFYKKILKPIVMSYLEMWILTTSTWVDVESRALHSFRHESFNYETIILMRSKKEGDTKSTYPFSSTVKKKKKKDDCPQHIL